MLKDQKAIWTSPAELRWRDLKWMVPIGTAVGISMKNDVGIHRQFVGLGRRINLSQNISNAGLAGFAGLGGITYLVGVSTHNRHARETGVLTAEAMTNALIFGQVVNYSTGRDRPGEGDGKGAFFDGGVSFPSNHSTMSWAAASVIAHEYPGTWTKLFVYGLATAVSATRVSGNQHWFSDTLVGSTAGWLIGRQVYRAHHDQDLGGVRLDPKVSFDRSQAGMMPHDFGSTYVPLDSWVYPALRRLAAMGHIDSQILGLQPWTRAECNRQTLLAERSIDADAELDENDDEARRLVTQLKAEFEPEAEGEYANQYHEFRVESVYFRYAGIGGEPLRNSFDFGQTIVNDFGRPFAEGSNVIGGFSVRGTSGPFAIYFRGEYQHSPSATALPLSARQFIHTMDLVPLPPDTPDPSIDRFRVLEAYVQTNVGNMDVSVGKQSLWWGPTDMGPWMYSNNSEPIYMLRVNNRRPFRLPQPFRFFGEIRGEFFFGKQSGHINPARPMLHGQKISLKVTKNLEVGFSRTVTFSGQGRAPLTLGTFGHSFFSAGDNTLQNVTNDPGDRRGGFDFSYRVPFVRNYVTVYSDSYVDDDPSPLAAPRRAAINPGIYIARLPKLEKFDFRAEAAYSDVPAGHFPGRFVYFNTVYLDGYVNNKNLIGNWVGREAKGYQFWTTYWHSAESTVQVGYRQAKASKDFLPGGSTQNQVAGRFNLRVRPQVQVSGTVQYERWLVPVIDAKRRQDVTAMFGVTFFPEHPLVGQSKKR